MARHVLQVGCDAMHDQHQNYRGFASPGILAKVMTACEDALKLRRITADDMAKIGQLATYLGTLFPRQCPQEDAPGVRGPEGRRALPRKPAASGWNG